MFRRSLIAGTAGALALPHLARAQAMPKIIIGMSGWTGFAPLTLAEQAGLFKANGVEVETKFVPQRERNLALASGALNCVVTTVDTMILWINRKNYPELRRVYFREKKSIESVSQRRL